MANHTPCCCARVRPVGAFLCCGAIHDLHGATAVVWTDNAMVPKDPLGSGRNHTMSNNIHLEEDNNNRLAINVSAPLILCGVVQGCGRSLPCRGWLWTDRPTTRRCAEALRLRNCRKLHRCGCGGGCCGCENDGMVGGCRLWGMVCVVLRHAAVRTSMDLSRWGILLPYRNDFKFPGTCFQQHVSATHP